MSRRNAQRIVGFKEPKFEYNPNTRKFIVHDLDGGNKLQADSAKQLYNLLPLR